MAAAVRAIRDKKRKRAETRAKVHEVFGLYDSDGNGVIDRSELRVALADLGVSGVTDVQLTRVVKRFTRGDVLLREQFEKLVFELQRQQTEMEEENSIAAGSTAACFLLPTWRFHEKAQWLYHLKVTQMGVALMIISNFAVNVYEKEIDPFPSELQRHSSVWDECDRFFNIVFRAHSTAGLRPSREPHPVTTLGTSRSCCALTAVVLVTTPQS